LWRGHLARVRERASCNAHRKSISRRRSDFLPVARHTSFRVFANGNDGSNDQPRGRVGDALPATGRWIAAVIGILTAAPALFFLFRAMGI
jgi:hypothetical protein